MKRIPNNNSNKSFFKIKNLIPNITTMKERIPKGMKTYTRSGRGEKKIEGYEKLVILPELKEKDPVKHAWADTRFATDIMAEHGLFFALLMPEELAPRERKQAIRFSKLFTKIHEKVRQIEPKRESIASFIRPITDEMKRFIEYKQAQHEAQVSGKLRSLVWPLFFEHTQREAERWVRRLETLAKGNSEFERSEVVDFWTKIMDEHARFVAHLLDPDEYELIEKVRNTSNVFRQFHEKDEIMGTMTASVREPGTVIGSLRQNPEVDAVLSAAETILDFKTKAVRDIEKARIKSIIDPRLADHVRREALKFVDELRRAE